MSTVALVQFVERRAVPRAAAPRPAAPRGERDFGTGYGRSSGYASPRSYVERRATSFFRCR
jgi:hypothetical protein